MRRLSIALVVLALGLPVGASAQTTPADIFPLDERNRWVFVRSSFQSATSGYGSQSRSGSFEWVVDGTAEIDGETLPRLAMTFTATNGSGERACAVGTDVDEDLVSFPFYTIPGDLPCAPPANYVENGELRDGFQVNLAELTDEDLTVGGTSLENAPTFFGTFSAQDGGYYRAVVGLGFVWSQTVDDFGPGSRSESATLRRAEIGGETFGSALDPGEGFFPLAEGDTWTFAVDTREAFEDPYTAAGYVRWTVEAGANGPVLVVDRIEDGVRTTLGACAATLTNATAVNGYRQTVFLGDAPDADCPGDLPYALPNRDPITLWSGSTTEQPGLFIDAFRPDETLTIGGSELQTDVATGDVYRIGLGVPGVGTSWTVGRGVGVVAFGASRSMSDSPRSWRATAEYVRVGGMEYGANPVADEAAPETRALGVAVSPNPARGTARLALSGEARARVTVHDALGRVVRTLDAAPGTVALSLDGLGAGVYLVRAETARGVATTRLTVVR